MSNLSKEEAIKYLSVLHLGYSNKVKEACEMGIKAIQRDHADNAGHWILDVDKDNPENVSYKCSVCGKPSKSETDFCANCGSDMRNSENLF